MFSKTEKLLNCIIKEHTRFKKMGLYLIADDLRETIRKVGFKFREYKDRIEIGVPYNYLSEFDDFRNIIFKK